MFKITLTAGTEFMKDGKPVADLPAKLRAIRQHIAATFGGFTEVQTFGGWIGPDGALVMEAGRQWTILDSYPHDGSAALIRARARGMAETIAVVLNQEAVVCEVAETRFEFVGQHANDNASESAAA